MQRHRVAAGVEAARADVEHDLGVERGQRAVALRAEPHRDLARVAPRVAHELLRARQLEAHRAAGQHRQPRGVVNDPLRARLGAEAAAHALHDDPHLVLLEPERLRELALDVPHALRGLVDGEPRAVPLRDAAAGLDVDVVLGRQRVAALADQVRLGESTLDVAALAHVDRLLDVALRGAARRPGPARAGRPGFMASRGVRAAGSTSYSTSMRPRACDRDVDGLRGDHRDLLTGVGDVRRERGLGDHVPVGVPARGVLAGEHRVHAGQGGRARRVHAADARVRVRAAQDLGVQHARPRHVGGVHRGAGHLLERVAAVDRAADDGELASEGRRHLAVDEQAALRRRRRARGAGPGSSGPAGGVTDAPPAGAQGARGGQRGLHGVGIGAAAAEVAADGLADVLLADFTAGIQAVVQQRLQRHEDARDAGAALDRIVLDERGLERMEAVGAGQALHRLHHASRGLHRQHRAGEHRAAVEHDGAAAALGAVAADLGAGEAQVSRSSSARRAPRRDLHAGAPARSRPGTPGEWRRRCVIRADLVTASLRGSRCWAGCGSGC